MRAGDGPQNSLSEAGVAPHAVPGAPPGPRREGPSHPSPALTMIIFKGIQGFHDVIQVGAEPGRFVPSFPLKVILNAPFLVDLTLTLLTHSLL